MEDAWIVAILGLLVPIILMVLVIVPPYGGAVYGLYNVYGDMIIDKWHNFDIVYNTMLTLYRYWETSETATFGNFFLPAFGPIIGGAIFSIAGVVLFLRYVRNVFRV